MSENSEGNYLYVHNFGPIKEAKVYLKRFMVFIGSQGTGKSTIAKLLTIFQDVFWWWSIVNKLDVILEFSKMGIDKYFNDDTVLEFKYHEIEIYGKGKSFEIKISSLKQEKIHEALNVIVGGKSAFILSNLGVDYKNVKDVEIQKYFSDIRKSFRIVCYMPAERNTIGVIHSSLANLVLAIIPIPNMLLEYIALYERAKNSFNEYYASFLGVSYENGKGKDCILVDKESKKYLPLESCSSGVQSALPLLMVLDYAIKEYDSFVVEEPEQNLFPENQKNFLNTLISHINTDVSKKMIVTTHSPYILSSLNNCMLAAHISENEELRKAVEEILPHECQISSSDVAVYALGDNEEYCKSLMDEKTGLISSNFLDSASEYIGSDFNRLYKLFMKTIKNE